MCLWSLILLLKPFNLKSLLYRNQKAHLNIEVYFCLFVLKKFKQVEKKYNYILFINFLQIVWRIYV